MNVRAVVFLGALIAAWTQTWPSRAQNDVAERAQALVAGLDLEEARGELEAADAEDPRMALERARLAVYELDCDGAAAILRRPELEKSDAGRQLGEIARGCQRVTAALAVDADRDLAVEVRWQDEHDRVLAPLLLETVVRARKALTRDLGVDWPAPTRIVVVRDLLSLSAMTGLPYKSAQTTGTVAVAKWGRVTLLSPRASPHGYAWRDTVAHELTHLAVTRASRDRAPLWLQEGIAKREEVRWRDAGPFDDWPSADGIVVRGMGRKLALPLDRLGPSIAMLPSAEAATVAFAEVTSFVRFYVETQGKDALPKLLAAIGAGRPPDEALIAESGTDLKGWDARWRGVITSRPSRALSPLVDVEPGQGQTWIEARDRSRLAELLLARGHAGEALDELDHLAPGHGLTPAQAQARAADPTLRWLQARALEGAGRRAEGGAVVEDPRSLLSSFGPWWAVRGRWARLRGDEPVAVPSFMEAVAADPFNVEAACEAIDGEGPLDPRKGPLCDAARAAAAPPFEEE